MRLTDKVARPSPATVLKNAATGMQAMPAIIDEMASTTPFVLLLLIRDHPPGEIYEWDTWPRAALSPHNAAKHNQDPHEKTTQGNHGLIHTHTVRELTAASRRLRFRLRQIKAGGVK